MARPQEQLAMASAKAGYMTPPMGEVRPRQLSRSHPATIGCRRLHRDAGRRTARRGTLRSCMLKPGDTFDRYTVESVLGQGGMGCVYQAHDTRLDRRVALKIVVSEGDKPKPDLDTEAKVRMQRVARAAAALDHPNVVAIYDIGEVTGIPYIAMM